MATIIRNDTDAACGPARADASRTNAVVAGVLFRTPEQASAIGPAPGIGLGMHGGCMWPLAIVSPAMRTIGHFAPQAWAVDAWTILISRGGNLGSIALELGILAAFAIVLVGLASFRFHRSLTG